MRYYIIAGEASGDLHASNLMRALRNEDAGAEFRCWGGDLMQAAGGEIVKHYRDLAFMGFLEVALNFRTILRNFRLCERDILSWKPDVVILVDYPGFNLRMAKFAATHGCRVFYYISPQLWAWRSSRVHTIKKYVERMFVILPFEQDFYRKYGYSVDFTGHPLPDAIAAGAATASPAEFRSRNGLADKPVIALLPGSRKQEISVMLKIMLEVVPGFPQYHFVIGAAPSIPPAFYSTITRGREVHIVAGQTHDLLRNADAALVTSGTATLETALFGVPEVVCYKGNALSFWIARQVVHVKFISLVNLIMDRETVKELIQGELTPERLSAELAAILERKRSTLIRKDYEELAEKLGGPGASAKTAKLMVQYLQGKSVILNEK
jgi:lipid-A-disaccharide synthase